MSAASGRELLENLAQRKEISRAMVAGFSTRAIASILGRASPTVSREIKRNGGQAKYRAAPADQEATWERGDRPKSCKLAENRAFACIVAAGLQSFWPPEQIAGGQAYSFVPEGAQEPSAILIGLGQV